MSEFALSPADVVDSLSERWIVHTVLRSGIGNNKVVGHSEVELPDEVVAEMTDSNGSLFTWTDEDQYSAKLTQHVNEAAARAAARYM